MAVLVLCACLSASSQQQVNPATQVRWPVVTGTINPVAPAWPCTAANYGQPYTNTTTNTLFFCSSAGWSTVAGGGCTGATGTYSLSGQVATFASGCVTAVGSPYSVAMSCPQVGQYETGQATTNPFTCTLSYANGTPGAAEVSLPVVKTTVYTVAALPTGLLAGAQVIVSDATTFTPGTCIGGGSDYMIAIYNGTTWSCH